MGKFPLYILIAVLVLAMGGCKFSPVNDKNKGGKGGKYSSDTEQTQTEAEKDADARYGMGEDEALAMKALEDPNSLLSKRVLYFDLDSSQISGEARDIITAHAEFLAQHPDISIILEGHADERGTREYNLALGERRAKSVQQLFLLQGVAQNQIQIISFGEERPVALDHNESAWRLNRRVEILYSGY